MGKSNTFAGDLLARRVLQGFARSRQARALFGITSQRRGLRGVSALDWRCRQGPRKWRPEFVTNSSPHEAAN